MKTNSKFLLTAVAGVAGLLMLAPAVAAQGFGSWSEVNGPDEAAIGNIPGSVDQDINVTVDVINGIGLDCEDTVALSPIYGYGDSAKDVNCSVFTNHLGGYQVALSAMTPLYLNGNTAETLPENMFAASASDITSATKNAWAIKYTGAGGAWTSTVTDVITSGTSAAGARDFAISVRAHAGQNSTITTGTYTGSFTLTASTI